MSPPSPPSFNRAVSSQIPRPAPLSSSSTAPPPSSGRAVATTPFPRPQSPNAHLSGTALGAPRAPTPSTCCSPPALLLPCCSLFSPLSDAWRPADNSLQAKAAESHNGGVVAWVTGGGMTPSLPLSISSPPPQHTQLGLVDGAAMLLVQLTLSPDSASTSPARSPCYSVLQSLCILMRLI